MATSGVLAATAGAAEAGAVDPANPSTAVIFEPSPYVELGFGHLSSTGEGTSVPGLGGQSSGVDCTSAIPIGLRVGYYF